MPKSKEFFALLKEQGKINEAKFDELIEKMPDFDIPQEAVQAFENSFMTVDRAITHQDVNRKIKFETLNPINKDLEKIISVVASIDKVSADRLESLTRDLGAGAQGTRVPDTYKRMEFLTSSLGELFNKVKAAPAGGDEELKKELAKKDQTIQEALQKLSNSEKEFKGLLTQKESEFENKLHDYKLDSELEKMAGNYTLAEAYDKNRDAINKVILSELKGTNRLKLGTKDGQTQIIFQDENGEPRYNGNSPILINQLLEEKYKPFLKQSNVETDTTRQTSVKTVPVNGKQTSRRRGAPTTVEKTLK
jgi:hypothetical protein